MAHAHARPPAEFDPRPTLLTAWRAVRDRVLAILRGTAGPRYWAARVPRLERGTAPLIESRLRAAAGVLVVHVTPAIDGSATVSVSYDPRRATAESVSAVLEPIAPGFETIETPALRSPHPEDQCVC